MSFFLTYVLSLVLMTAPIPETWIAWWPHWGILFALWWGLMRNHRVSMVSMLLVSIPMDVVVGTAFGFHGLLLSVLFYVVTLIGPTVRRVNWLRQLGVVTVVLWLLSAVGYWGRTLIGQEPLLGPLMLQVTLTALAWPLFRALLEGVARMTGDYEVTDT